MSVAFNDLFQNFHNERHPSSKKRHSSSSSLSKKTSSKKTPKKSKDSSTDSSPTKIKKEYLNYGFKFKKISKSKQENKKFDAVFEHGTTKKLRVVSFGNSKENDYLQNKDRTYRDWYNKNHPPNDKNLMDPKTLNHYICWNRENLKDSIDHYARTWKNAAKS